MTDPGARRERHAQAGSNHLPRPGDRQPLNGAETVAMGIHTESAGLVTDELLTDSLTGFGTRSKLLADLAEAVRPTSPPTLLVIFGLEGFSEYVELLGRLEGQTLLLRLASRLAGALEPAGSCYRPRADEFGALVHTPIATVKPFLDAAVAALRERGGHVPVTASFGAAMLPDEASDPVEALQIADQRLSSNAPRRRPRNRRRHERST
jgi:GGDEF domain-containing protein